jgi:hypothetical protein
LPPAQTAGSLPLDHRRIDDLLRPTTPFRRWHFVRIDNRRYGNRRWQQVEAERRFLGPIIVNVIARGPRFTRPTWTVLAYWPILTGRTILTRAILTRSLFLTWLFLTRLGIAAVILARRAVLAIVTRPITIVAARALALVTTVAAILPVARFLLLRLAVIARLRLRSLDPRLGARIEFVAVERLLAVVETLLLALLLPAVAARLVFFVTRAGIGQHAEIMIAELQVIFGQHAVARLLGIARQRLVFFEQLRCVPARPVVDAIAIVLVAGTAAVPALGTLIVIAPAATATVLLTIVDQDKVVPNKEVKKFPHVPLRAVVSNPWTISRFAGP